jgi:hypothetical protein
VAGPDDTQGGGLCSSQDDADSSFSSSPVDSPVAACGGPTIHWITVRLLRLPDLKQRDSWWPVAPSGPYAGVKFNAQITDGPHAGVLDPQGTATFNEIPAGTCSFKVDKSFYQDIEQFFDAQLGKK